jgi:hypothetical protein
LWGYWGKEETMGTKIIVDGKECWLGDMVWFLFQGLSKKKQEMFWREIANSGVPPLAGHELVYKPSVVQGRR